MKKELTYQEFMGQMRSDIDCIYPAYVSQRGINAAYVMTNWHIDSMISEENFIGCTRVDSLEDLSSSDLYQWFCEFDGNTPPKCGIIRKPWRRGISISLSSKTDMRMKRYCSSIDGPSLILGYV